MRPGAGAGAGGASSLLLLSMHPISLSTRHSHNGAELRESRVVMEGTGFTHKLCVCERRGTRHAAV